MKERWRNIYGYTGVYQISDRGRVRSLKFNRIKFLVTSDNGDGYFVLKLYKDGVSRHHYISHLVAKAFIPNPKRYKIVHHKHGTHNDGFKNLEWCTSSKNRLYARRATVGKFSAKQIRYIRRALVRGEETCASLARKFDSGWTTIWSIKTRRTWKHVK